MTKSGFVIIFVLICLTLAGAIIGNAVQDEQDIQYNHKIHIEEAGLECIDCHLNVATNARASIPNIGICVDCHDDIEVENEEERKVADYVTRNVEIPWKQIHQVPDHVYFSHRRHVLLGKIECIECHGDVANMEKPFVMAYAEIDMSWCLDCHEQGKVSEDCSVCHR